MTSGYRAICYRAIAIGLLAIGGASCQLGSGKAPDLTGPSMFGVNVSLAASPDLLPRDGRTTSKIVASVRDGSNNPVAGLLLHLEVRIVGRPGVLGSLSQTDITTAADGTATALYTAPLPSATADTEDATIVIVVTPVGSNSSSQTSTTTTIRLAELGGPTATFNVTPDPVVSGEQAVFDARGSAPSAGQAIVGYFWDFGDGDAVFIVADGPTIKHEYFRSGSFTVRLRVMDSSGRSTTVTKVLTVIG